MIIFGFSSMLTELSDCLQANSKKIGRLVVNIPGQKHASASELSDRLRGLNEWPLITALEDFVPEEGEDYFVLPNIPKPWVLVEYLKKAHDLQFSRMIHPNAYVSPLAKIGQGVFVGAGCVIGPGAVLKDHVSLKAGAIVGHDAVLHEHVRVDLRCTIGGRAQIHAGSMVGPGATIVDDVVVGTGAVIAAGALVVKNVRDRDALTRPLRQSGNREPVQELRPRLY